MARGTLSTVARGLAALLMATTACVSASPECARTGAGWVCGARRVDDAGGEFVSFLGVPYARQPLAELRFQELQPPEPWEGVREATREGPACPQQDVFYGRIMRPRGFSEACIHANVHVPAGALPATPPPRARHPRPPLREALGGEPAGLPVFVFVHGGGFAFGSGDTDLHGPEYLVGRGVVVVTFNYRLNVFGFLSLNSSYVPGNAGLRDMVTLLRWVRDNIAAFGGNPDDVTLAGHSAGAVCAHLLTLSDAAKGLFNKALLMSGAGIPSFFSTTPAYAQFASAMFLSGLGINSTDPEQVHRQLVQAPLDALMQVHNAMLFQFGLGVFFPVVETSRPGVTTILDDDPSVLLAKGRGKDTPLMIGFTNNECYSFLRRFEEIEILHRVKKNPIILTSPHLIYSRPPKVALNIARRTQERYLYGELAMDKYLNLCSDAYFIYPAMKLAQTRAAADGAPVYLYEFSYQSDFSVKKEMDHVDFKGAGHLEDVTYLFRVNSILGPEGTYKPTRKDEDMKNWMVHFVTNFIKCSDPACNRERRSRSASPWPPFSLTHMRYQGIYVPAYHTVDFDADQLDMLRFFDGVQNGTS